MGKSECALEQLNYCGAVIIWSWPQVPQLQACNTRALALCPQSVVATCLWYQGHGHHALYRYWLRVSEPPVPVPQCSTRAMGAALFVDAVRPGSVLFWALMIIISQVISCFITKLWPVIPNTRFTRWTILAPWMGVLCNLGATAGKSKLKVEVGYGPDGLQASRSCDGSAGSLGVDRINNAGQSQDKRLAIACNFESDLCEWEINGTLSPTWMVGSRNDPNATDQGPMYDHTINERGHYLVVGLASGSSVQVTARLTSWLQTASACHQCLAFWYHMYGPKVGDLKLKVQQRGQGEALLWSRAASQGNEWRRGYLTIAPQLRHFQLIFEGSRRDGAGDIAIDDVSVVGGGCEPQQFCSFEADACSFTSTGAQTWQRESGASETRTTNRPPIDSTLETGQGHYMLADTSRRSLPIGQRLQLVSETQRPLDNACLQFTAHTSADSPGSLDVYVEDDQQMTRLVWTLDTGPLQTWTLATVGDTHGLWLEGTCDFESGLCGWRNVLNGMDTVDWTWSSSSVPSRYQTPATDHTLGTPEGHSVFVDMAAVSTRDTARLLSEHLPPTKGSCLTFHYRTLISQHLVHGPLKVFRFGADQESTLWEAKDGASESWREVNITVESAESFQVGFLVIKSNDKETGYIAIDDVDYRPGVNCFGVSTDQAVGGRKAQDGGAGPLRGIFAVYKPPGVHWRSVRGNVRGGLLHELNASECPLPHDQIRFLPEDQPGCKWLRNNLTVTKLPALANHPRVRGPRFVGLRIGAGHRLDWRSSGVFVLAVGSGNKQLSYLQDCHLTKEYTVHGSFGLATEDFSDTGRLIEKTTYDHITRDRLERIIAVIQGSHQKALITYSGIDLKSQAAYELACRGMLRPMHKSPPIITGIRCSEFSLPNFTLEVQCVHETQQYLRKIIHEIGLELKSSAVCTRVRRTRDGVFTLDDALIRTDWKLQQISSAVQRSQPRVAAALREESWRHTALSGGSVSERWPVPTEAEP
ncbi:uncharacterized protein LOC144608452 [Rhinoraja longicauda]